MNEQELKAKLSKIVCTLCEEYSEIDNRCVYFTSYEDCPMFNKIVEALIAANIGDVSEYKKHRVFVDISPALKGEEYISVPNTQPKIIQLYDTEEVEQIAKERNEYKHRAEVAERALKNICKNIRIDSGDKEDEIKANSDILYKSYLKQAEKELQEERKE